MDLSREPSWTDDSAQLPRLETAGPAQTERLAVHDRWASLLILAVSVWVVLPRIAQSITAPKHLSNVGVDNPPLTGVSSLSSNGLALVLVALCLFIVIDVAKEARPGRLSGLVVMLTPWVYLIIRDMFLGKHPDRASLAYPVIVGTLWLLRPRVEVLRSLGYVAGAAAAISIAMAVVLPSKGLLYSTTGDALNEGKAIIGSHTLVGFLTHGNALGQFLALGLPFIGMVPRRRLRWWLFALTGFALVWTAARSILAAVVLSLVAMAVVAASDRITRRWLAPVIVTVPFVVGGILPFLTTNPTAFTNRGLIWSTSIAWWKRSPLIGLGSDWYARVGNTSGRLAGSVFNGHNQLIHLLVTGGLLMAVAVAVQLVMAAGRSGEVAASGSLFAVGYLVTLAGALVLERALAIVDNASLLPMTAIPLTVLICGRLSSVSRESTTGPDLGADRDPSWPDPSTPDPSWPAGAPGRRLPSEAKRLAD
jgi:hypothetical protein